MKNKYYFSRLVLILFRVIWFISALSKVLYPKVALSWIRSFLLSFTMTKSIVLESLIPVWIVLILIISFEVILMINLTNNKFTIRLNIFLTVFFLTISLVVLIFEIPGDCGCFGEIIVWENNYSKIIFNIILVAGSICLYRSYLKSGQIVEVT